MNEVNDERLERTVRYLEGEMDAAERVDFERNLTDDPGLRRDLEAARRTLAGLRALGEERLRTSLKKADAGVVKPRSYMAWWWAAAAVLMIGVGSWWMLRDTPQRLANEFAFKDPGLPVLMGGGSRMDAIMNAYKQGDLHTSERLIQEALASTPGNDTLTYFTGVIALRQARYTVAVEDFTQLGAASVFHDRACYHRAIALIHLGDVDAARSQLQVATGSKDPQVSTHARRLLERL